MWLLQGMLLYRAIEHRNEDEADRRDRVDAELPTAYGDLIRDPRVNPEEANKIAA